MTQTTLNTTAICKTYEEAFAYGSNFVAESLHAPLERNRASSFVIFEVAGIYGPYFEVSFTRELTPALAAELAA